MTFEDYWYSCCDFHHCDDCDITVDCAVDKAIAQSAWEAAQLQSKDEIDALTKERNKWIKRCDTSIKKAWKEAQPKWTYCKDRYPTEVDGEVKKGCIGFRKNLRLVGVIGLSRDSDFGFEVTFNLTENHFESDDREVIAWMSLPEYKEQTK